MGFTSASGTGFAALIAASALFATSAGVASLPASGATLDVAVSGLRSTKGNVLICVTAAPKHFPNCDKDPAALKRTVKAVNATHIAFADVRPGTYALALVHDENGNGKLDTRLIIPREGFGFSRNPTITFGPPKFSAAEIAVKGDSTETLVKMKYML